MTGDVTVFEGPDGGGKTTLIERLRGPRTTIVHLGPHRGDPLTELLAHLASNASGPVSFDRFHLGEQVYGPIYRGVDALGEAGRRTVETILARRRAVVVMCLPPYETAHANWEARRAAGGEMFPDDAAYGRLYAAYCGARTTLPLVVYDYTTTSAVAFARVLAEVRAASYNGRRGA